MNIKKRMAIYIGIFIMFFSVLLYLSRESNDYISIATNRESIDVFNKGEEKIFLYKKEGDILKRIPIFVYLNDYMNIRSKEGEYLVEVQEKQNITQEILVRKNAGEVLDLDIKYTPKIDLRKNNIFLNILTVVFFLFNLKILYSFKKDIMRKKAIIFPISLLCLKILLTNSELFSNVILIRTNLILTSILGLYLLLYVKNKSYQIKNDKVINTFLWILFIMYYTGEVVMGSAILSSKILVYLATNYSRFLKISVFFYIWIDALIIILLIFLLESIKIKKKQIIKESEKKNLAMIGSFIILSLAVEIFINNNKYFYYLNMFEFVYVFWYIFLTDINTAGKINIFKLKTFQMFLHVYLFFVITENLWIAIGIVGSFTILNIYTYFITGALRVNRGYIENLINRMYLTKNCKEFKEQLSKELKKNLELIDVDTKILTQRNDYKKFLIDREYDDSEVLLEKIDILDSKYDYALRLKYSKNPFVALVLIGNRGTKLVYEEKRYLEEISEKISLVASSHRIEKLQEELS